MGGAEEDRNSERWGKRCLGMIQKLLELRPWTFLMLGGDANITHILESMYTLYDRKMWICSVLPVSCIVNGLVRRIFLAMPEAVTVFPKRLGIGDGVMIANDCSSNNTLK